MESKKIFKILTLLLIMQWAFIKIVAQFPEFIDQFYSYGLYRYISNILRFSLGWLPFSVGDILYILLVFFIFFSLIYTIKQRNFKFKTVFFKIGSFISVLFFLFNFNWGLNYLRPPLYKTLNIQNAAYSEQELYEFSLQLIEKINEVHFKIVQNDTLVIENSKSKSQLNKMAPLAFEKLKLKHSEFQYKNPSLKSSLLSVPLTYMGFAGYLNPFTNEAQVNSLIPKNIYPATICHEISHQIGIASESEANFVGYLASTESDDAYFNYAGYLIALKYCLNEIYFNNEQAFEVLKSQLNIGIVKDLQQQQNFWKSYQNISNKYFKAFYDQYLKANQQKDGIKSYHKMVHLLINYYKTNKL